VRTAARPAGHRLWLALLVGLAGVSLYALGPWPSSHPDVLAVLTIAVAAAAVEGLTVDFPDRKRVSVSYVFTLTAGAIFGVVAGVLTAGAAGLLSGLLSREKLRSTLFHAPQLILATAAGAYTATHLPGSDLALGLDVAGVMVAAVFALVYSAVALGLGWIERGLAARDRPYPTVDVVTNLLLIPVPLTLTALYRRAGANALSLGALSLVALLTLVRDRINLSALHRDLQHAHERLQQQQAELEKSVETNRDLTALITHDLRSPLTAVMGYTDLLARSFDQPEADGGRQRDHIARVRLNAQRILDLAEDLLKLQQVEQAASLTDLSRVQPRAVLRQVVDELELQAEQQAAKVSLDVDDSLQEITTSEWMLHEIAHNLVSNAIKYSQGGAVRIQLGPRNSGLQLEVADTGIGISEEDQQKLFTKFFRSGSAEVRSVPGTGLGLALTGTMVKKLGGHIEIWSELGHGTRVTVHLPSQAQAA